MRIAALALALALAPLAAHADQPLSAGQRFAQDAIIVDTHIDAPTGLLRHWADLGLDTPKVEFDYPRARQGGLDIAFMSIYTSPGEDAAGTATQTAHTQIDAVEAMVGRRPEQFAVLRSPKDFERLNARNQRVLLALGMENGAPIGDDLSRLKLFFDRGVRYITLAHSEDNRISDSSYSRKRTWKGLSPFGEKVVDEMNRLGIMVDVSHLSDDAVRDVLARSKAPVIASHSGLRHFTPGFERNLSDELAKAVAAKGGVVQVVFGNAFVDPASAADTQAYFVASAKFEEEQAAARKRGETPKSSEAFDKQWEAAHPPRTVKIDAVLDQIDYAVKLLGADHVGIGSDFDGVSGALPEGLKSVADYPNLIDGLKARGHSDETVRKVLGGNLLRVWGEVEAKAVRS
ncbi:dipeptidase [Lysobacter enzymogenes]|uniref:Membrane dipeptidase n=1 Tax=Lysobacter enzymogenes TaxID=69 RepID=A0A3N2RCR5_LYSEN|nr:dipeptidase [Lysobacter enzymogenes]ROU05194.1 membrane dipeptidase [Lysobacter enzymogenes]